jgi:hypothetical protein
MSKLAVLMLVAATTSTAEPTVVTADGAVGVSVAKAKRGKAWGPLTLAMRRTEVEAVLAPFAADAKTVRHWFGEKFASVREAPLYLWKPQGRQMNGLTFEVFPSFKADRLHKIVVRHLLPFGVDHDTQHGKMRAAAVALAAGLHANYGPGTQLPSTVKGEVGTTTVWTTPAMLVMLRVWPGQTAAGRTYMELTYEPLPDYAREM